MGLTTSIIPLRVHNHEAFIGGGKLGIDALNIPLFIPAMSGFEGGGSAAVQGLYGVIELPDAAEQSAYLTVKTPFTPSRVDVLMWAPATANMRISFTTQFGLVTEVYAANTDSIAEYTQAMVLNVVTAINITAALTNFVANDTAGIRVTRHADDGLDTVNLVCTLLGTLLTP